MANVSYQFDEHMSGVVARELRRLGISVETAAEAGLLGAPDEDHINHALQHGRVVVTRDADFADLHWRIVNHGGIVYFPAGRRRSIGDMVESLRLVHAVYTAEEMVGRLEYL